eukprot:4098537-Lingulodinium_polyedra.AAC.1
MASDPIATIRRPIERAQRNPFRVVPRKKPRAHFMLLLLRGFLAPDPVAMLFRTASLNQRFARCRSACC